jgi:hypothetical protein
VNRDFSETTAPRKILRIEWNLLGCWIALGAESALARINFESSRELRVLPACRKNKEPEQE